MKTFLNILWHIPFLGFVIAFFVAVSGVIWSLTIVGLPIGLGLFQFSWFLLWPHGNAMISKTDLGIITKKERNPVWKIFAMIVRILYFPFGLIHAAIMVVAAFMEFCSIVGIPFGLVIVKSLSTYFNPVDKVRVPEAIADEIKRKKNEKTLNKYRSSDPTPKPQEIPTQQVVVKVVCPNCDKLISEVVTFCPFCGAPLHKKKSIPAPAEEKVQKEEEQIISAPKHEEDNLRFAPPQYRK